MQGAGSTGDTFDSLVAEVRACRVCARYLPLGPRPIFQIGRKARILIAGQAPGRKVAETGVPFDDPSGDRLRDWMGITREAFYDPEKVAILPIGFCYPGKAESGDRPPRHECPPLWRKRLLEQLPALQLTLAIGQYAQAWHLGGRRKANLTDTVRDWRAFGPTLVPLPHSSPRNNPWLAANPWFAGEVLPTLKQRVKALVGA